MIRCTHPFTKGDAYATPHHHSSAGATGTLLICLFFCLSLGLQIPALAGAATGDLDTTFDLDGIVNQDLGSNANDIYQAVAIQSDGRIVAVGYSNGMGTTDVVVARYMTDGTLDTSFGGTGIVYIDIGGLADTAYDVAIQGDGKIVVAGQSGGQFLVMRFNNDGTLDTSGFGSPNGYVTTTIGTSAGVQSVAIQSDSKIVVAGDYVPPVFEEVDFLTLRYNQDGSLDTSFSGDGKLVVNLSTYGTIIHDLAFQSDDKIVVAASSYDDNEPAYRFTVARLTTAGSMDSTFGTNGVTRIEAGYYSGDDIAHGVAIQRDGNIVAVGRGQFEISGSFDKNQNALVMRFGGDTAPPLALAVPTLNDWGRFAFIIILATLAIRTMRGKKKRTAGL